MKSVFANIETHTTLNPKLWDGDTLKRDVYAKLMEIVDTFINYIELDLVVIDAQIVGSNASYNYTSASDLDVHLIVNYSRIDASPEVAELLMWSQKKMFNDEYDISIHGINVELYVENVNSNTMSNGIYSLFNDEWIRRPQIIDVTIDEAAVDTIVDKIEPQILTVLDHGTLDDTHDMIDSLYLMRKNGLANTGEYDPMNLAFKELRNSGYLDDLKDKVIDLRSAELSIN